MKLALLATLLLSTVPGPTTGQGWKLTPAGWGPVRMGMNRDEVSNALHRELEGEALDNEGSCIELFPKGGHRRTANAVANDAVKVGVAHFRLPENIGEVGP